MLLLVSCHVVSSTGPLTWYGVYGRLVVAWQSFEKHTKRYNERPPKGCTYLPYVRTSPCSYFLCTWFGEGGHSKIIAANSIHAHTHVNAFDLLGSPLDQVDIDWTHWRRKKRGENIRDDDDNNKRLPLIVRTYSHSVAYQWQDGHLVLASLLE